MSTPQPAATGGRERVFVSGVGVVSSIGCDFDHFAAALRRGDCGAAPAERFFGPVVAQSGLQVCKVQDFDAASALPGEDLSTMDPLVQFTLAASREALRRAGLAPQQVDPQRAGLLFGTASGGADNKLRFVQQTYREGEGDLALAQDFPHRAIGRRLQSRLGWRGTNLAFSSSCTSASIAIGYASEAVASGRFDVVLCGGADFIDLPTLAIMNGARLLTRGPMRPFDRRREGMVMGEGAGVLCLESERHLRARRGRPMAEVLGWGSSSEAHAGRAAEPTGRWLALALQRALNRAGVEADAVDYVNAHGAATDKDLAEARALRKVFGERSARLPVSSTKPMYGYPAGSAGALDAACVLAAMRDGFLPPTIHLEQPDPRVGLDNVPLHARAARVDTALSINCGAGGSCSALLLRHSTELPYAPHQP
ncbi:beta-ketoacyl-[acyl-carrier-protein] synthase family protein [Ideonella sp. 4Y11]|uniref:Beta-ketoacyl-[acyl-carrier-protein] synthase family protein n=1 Tax=Ideonella aquatica TaxID=2824119 RepID=A0A940YHK1_9BURK|nr:beta-ketoacyl-[acyl-carrier-protein] synthase family protein [Ideonella aquatica]MBQ0957964.1 beta-ketoacyl-[acyl-carrier-protein] synthase family protein [Ideonella aquatica]